MSLSPDVTPISLGIESARGMTAKVINRNTVIPVKARRIFTTADDEQTIFMVTVTQGEQPMSCANTILASFAITEMLPLPRGTPRIEVIFDIDENGILHVSARDKVTGRAAAITIASKGSGLSEKEIEWFSQKSLGEDLFSIDKIASLVIHGIASIKSTAEAEASCITEGQELAEISRRFSVAGIRRGGMGRVYLVNVPGYPLLALKTLNEDALSDAASVHRFLREASTWIRIGKHPNIVTAYSVQPIAGKPFIFLEGVEGKSLADVVAQGRLSLDLALDYATQICEAMQFVHRKLGLVHRDLKPHNVLVTRDGTAKVTDFGLANVIESYIRNMISDSDRPGDVFKTRFGAVAGTCAYMAPEQFLALKLTDTRSDIYSFGVMFHELLTHRLPYSATNFDEYRKMHLDASPPKTWMLQCDIPAGVRAIVMKCLSKHPEQRYQSFGELKSDLVAELTMTGRSYEAPLMTGALSVYDLALDGFLLLNANSIDEADGFFNTAASLEPAYPWAWVGAGCCRALRDDIPAALKCFDHALHLSPENQAAQVAITALLKNKRR